MSKKPRQKKKKKKQPDATLGPKPPDVVPARVDGDTLYLKMPSGKEESHKWAGPATAHHAHIEFHDSTHVYAIRIERKISVFDEAGTLLGEIVEESWL